MNVSKIHRCIEDGLRDTVFPGCAVGICTGNSLFSHVYGYTSDEKKEKITKNTLFDLASLTKPLATTLACLMLIKEGKINYNTTLESLLGCSVPDDKKNINLAQLLSHSSGFAAHYDFYKNLEKYPLEKRKNILLKDILHRPLSYLPGSKTLYSDVGFILLFFMLEFQTKVSFETFVHDYIVEPMHIQDVCYNPKEKGYSNFASTENCPWRNKVMAGEVHDQNTWILGGVSGQAGLFGTIDSVLAMVVYIKDVFQGRKNHPYIDRELLQEAFLKRGGPESSWGLGFDTPSQPGSSAGRYISTQSCGHLGFTGTSFWIDFDRDIAVVLLTNRINPTVDNMKLRDFRPLFHDIVFESQMDRD
ncbi:MAG: serine hydrolase [Desulfobulbaceae bacterium]|nr:serine hydrolase [Desulfobulbaceae bacterium]